MVIEYKFVLNDHMTRFHSFNEAGRLISVENADLIQQVHEIIFLLLFWHITKKCQHDFQVEISILEVTIVIKHFNLNYAKPQ